MAGPTIKVGNVEMIALTDTASTRDPVATFPSSTLDEWRHVPGVLNDVVIARILKPEYFDDPADLARLPAVSRAMRAAVAETGLRFEELEEYDAAELGCLSVLKRMQRGGRLSRQAVLCQAAARSRQLEELTVLRADGWPWDRWTCAAAARGGHLEVLQWARANGCPWDELTCYFAALGGHLNVLQWARANGCPWNKDTLSYAEHNGDPVMLQWLRDNGAPE